jgi:hypothetical protein
LKPVGRKAQVSTDFVGPQRTYRKESDDRRALWIRELE